MMERFRLPRWLADQPHFNVPLVAIQSDDWGHLSGGSAQLLSGLVGASPSSLRGWMLDAPETAEDLAALASVLQPLRDGSGRAPCITANCIVSEADHEAIEASAFQAYSTRPSTVLTVVRQAATDPSTATHFDIQLHGSEHIAPALWLYLLRQGDAMLRRFFDARTMPPPALLARYPGLSAAYLPTPFDGPGVPTAAERLTAAVATFRALFDRAPIGFVAPNHAWDDAIERQLGELGIRYLQACHVQYRSFAAIQEGRWITRGSSPSQAPSLWRQTRTINFEPAIRPTDCAAAIRLACLLASRGAAVVINTHRANYVSLAGRERAAQARARLSELLQTLLAFRPDLRFVSGSDYDAALRGDLHGVRRCRAKPMAQLANDFARALLGKQPAASEAVRTDISPT
jgi:hypothetical protein